MKTCVCAAKSEIDCSCGADWLCAECERLRERVADLESDLAAKAHLIELLLDERRKTEVILEGCASLMGDYAVSCEDMRKDAARYRWLRDAKPCQLILTRNDDHACNYMTAAEWIDRGMDVREVELTPPNELERMRATNTIWKMQIYPNTPIGFHLWYRATLDAAIDAAMAEPDAQGASDVP